MAGPTSNSLVGWRLLQTGCVVALIAFVVMVALPARVATVEYQAVEPVGTITYTLADGSVVSIERAVVVVATVGLEECAESGLGLGDRLRSVLGVAPVLAGHDVAAAPGEIRGPIVVELIGPPTGDRILGSGLATAWTFCRGHVALGQSRADAETGVRAVTGDEDLSGLSLRASGTVTTEAGSEPFWVESHRSHGGFVEFETAIRIADERRLTLGFKIEQALAGFDPTAENAGDRALEALVDATTIGS